MYVHISINTHKTNEGKIKIIQKKVQINKRKLKQKKKNRQKLLYFLLPTKFEYVRFVIFVVIS